MAQSYLPILILVLVACAFAGVVMLVSSRLGPHRPTALKSMPYECGIPPLQPARRRFPVQFYQVAMLFVIFDVEAIFFFPWAVIFRRLQLFGLIEMLIFVMILLVGYLFVWRMGAFKWD
ncbi:MAG: NADH-quinone oxidoreductase subunit A [Chloroflexota bacterium]|nr:MAG: NADH-quinone oxidoreductase subunit A [Chloroflexota bacterium]